MRFFALVGLLFCYCISPLLGQNTLELAHRKKGKVDTYELGTSLKLQCAWQSSKVMGELTRIEPDYFVLTREVALDPRDPENLTQYHERIAMDDVVFLYPEPNLHLRKFQRTYSMGAMVVGSLMIGGSIAEAMMNENPPKLTHIGIASGILFSGLVVRYFGRQKIRLGKKWRLRVQ